MTKPTKVNTSFRLNPQLKEALTRESKAKNMSLNTCVEEALELWLQLQTTLNPTQRSYHGQLLQEFINYAKHLDKVEFRLGFGAYPYVNVDVIRESHNPEIDTLRDTLTPLFTMSSVDDEFDNEQDITSFPLPPVNDTRDNVRITSPEFLDEVEAFTKDDHPHDIIVLLQVAKDDITLPYTRRAGCYRQILGRTYTCRDVTDLTNTLPALGVDPFLESLQGVYYQPNKTMPTHNAPTYPRDDSASTIFGYINGGNKPQLFFLISDPRFMANDDFTNLLREFKMINTSELSIEEILNKTQALADVAKQGPTSRDHSLDHLQQGNPRLIRYFLEHCEPLKTGVLS